MAALASLMASMERPVRPAPTGGMRRLATSSSFSSKMPVMAGTSSGEKTAEAPKASASTERSIMLTEAREGQRWAMVIMPFACDSGVAISSSTVMPNKEVAGKESTGMVRLEGA